MSRLWNDLDFILKKKKKKENVNSIVFAKMRIFFLFKYQIYIHKSEIIWYINTNIYNFCKTFYNFGTIFNEEFSDFFHIIF